ncbi:MAG: undecaprenyldiphospho-muramoylpentapeptide beta-N-acetylglucosaminyltransferase [Deltaproteobacteria bacterium]|nr:undecaprenyldiphospho-muramoylpentapeptide beta-N-acetylglucosaminyltransferase [Deltaproteobacteria bacterium]
MSLRPLNAVLAGGGTGGHVIPAIAVAEEILRLGGRARFIGLSDRLEARLVPRAGFGIDFIKVHPLAGGGVKHIARGLSSVPAAVLRSMILLGGIKPQVVLGVGGYVAGPVVLAAKILRIRTALLEQNATVGLTNRLLSRMVDRAFVTYEETASAFGEKQVVITGNPVKTAIAEAAKKRKKNKGKVIRIVVMGGSQGARSIDERVPAAMALAELAGEVTVLHQCGRGREENVKTAYQEAGVEVTVVPFIDDMASTYLDADLVVARAGATTVSELTVMGLPAVLLPYPHHADRQQERNAGPMGRAGAAIVLNEKLTEVREMADAISAFVRDEEQRSDAAKASVSLGRPGAARRVVDGLAELTEWKT